MRLDIQIDKMYTFHHHSTSEKRNVSIQRKNGEKKKKGFSDINRTAIEMTMENSLKPNDEISYEQRSNKTRIT